MRRSRREGERKETKAMKKSKARHTVIQASQTSIGPSVLIFLHGVVGERSVLRLPTEVCVRRSIRLDYQHIPVGDWEGGD